jgi:hypothetical protein
MLLSIGAIIPFETAPHGSILSLQAKGLMMSEIQASLPKNREAGWKSDCGIYLIKLTKSNQTVPLALLKVNLMTTFVYAAGAVKLNFACFHA